MGEYQAYVYDKNPDWYVAQELATFTLKVVPTQVTDLKLYQDGWPVTGEEPLHLSGTQPQQLTVKGCLDGVYITIPNQALEMTSTEGSYIYTLDGENGLEFFAEDQSMHTFTVSLADNPQVTVSFQATAQRIDVTGLTVTYPEVFYIEGWNGLGNQYVGITSHDTDPERRYEINIEPYNATVKDVVWVSHDPDVAEFQATYGNGIVPKKAGTARFTVTSVDNPAATQDITIRFAYKHPLEQVEMEETALTLAQYESMNLDLLVTPSNATNQRFAWTYSQDGIVKVNDYVTSTPGTMTTTHTLSALEQGTVTVTGTPLDDTQGAKPIQFTVTVTGQEEDAVRQAIALLTRSLRQTAQQPPYSAMELQILGPAPAPVVKVNGSYRYRTMILGRNDRQLRQLLSAFMREFAQRGENRRLHIHTDCNLMD